MNHHTSVTTRHPLQPYWDLALASVQADALRVALELKLFRLLAEPMLAGTVAERLRLHPDNTAHLLEMLWSMRLLERQQGDAPTLGWIYRASSLARRYLDCDSDQHCGDAWNLRLQALRHFGKQLGEQLRSGEASTAPRLAGTAANWQAAARLQIAQEQRAATTDAALAVISQLPEFPRAERLLDLGGGPGLVAIALAKVNPTLHGEVFDLAQTISVAEENIVASGLGERLRGRAGDLIRDPLGEGYDLIWCSSVLHFVPDINQALSKIHAALRPGGVLVCAQAEIPDDQDAARQMLSYYLSMRMLGRQLTHADGLRQAMERAGFTALETLREVPFPMTPVTAVIGRRSSR
ncbi:methyltransferase domain-containing protein [Ectopseudomonas alcaliphila]|uniref:Methyltransferase n=1 Tax=Ectopseudomonas alcaliphila TaxID=101564 RepID=A0A1G6VF53_9GAMM|nr:methyltransferase domain-containing protein [Pseudomonas alcaliphila]MDX5991781.1 methyltransferase [Pseudomonas alcaliphila]SDD52144.1 Ubiquinone/menaquinone biosynthesis C-methylase UbiE [Pseudomonas alcaliphila]